MNPRRPYSTTLACRHKAVALHALSDRAGDAPFVDVPIVIRSVERERELAGLEGAAQGPANVLLYCSCRPPSAERSLNCDNEQLMSESPHPLFTQRLRNIFCGGRWLDDWVSGISLLQQTLIPAFLSDLRCLVTVISSTGRRDLSGTDYNVEIKRRTVLYTGSRLLILMNIRTSKVDQR